MSPPHLTTPYEGREPTNADILRTLAPMADTLTKLDRHVTGGDEPEKGLIIKVDRLTEAHKAQRRWTLAALTGGGGGVLAAIKAWMLTGQTPTNPHP